MKKVVLVAFICLIIGIVGSAFYSREAFSITKGNEVSESKKIDVEAIDNISANIDVGDINVVPSDDEQITVRLNGKTSRALDGMNFEVEEKGDTLNIILDSQKKFWFNFSVGSIFNIGSLQLNISLPEKQYNRLEVASDVGDVHIGRLDVVNLHASSDVGDIEVEQLTSEHAKLGSNVGDVEVTSGIGGFDIQTDTGEIELNMEEFTEDIFAKSDVGDVQVSFDKKPNNIVFDLRSDIGDVEVSNIGGFSNSSGKDVYVEIGENGATLQAVTDVGEVDIE